MNPTTRIVIGGGAAGFFAAIACAEANPLSPPLLLEKGAQLLTKVRISGGGRCNVTHACFDPAKLVHYYPRGGKALRGPFSRFQPEDTFRWFQDRGVSLKTEEDGRVFPVSNSSQTIIDCLTEAARAAHVDIRCRHSVEGIERTPTGFALHLAGHPTLLCEKVLLATGSNRAVWQWLETLGHTILPPVPSLFTFNVPTSPLKELSGVAVEEAHLEIDEAGLAQTGPLLLTHWGFSGPAALKLSAWGARFLHDCAYKATLNINWLPRLTENQLRTHLLDAKNLHPTRSIGNEALSPLPRQLWRALVAQAEIDPSMRWSFIPNKQLFKLAEQLHKDAYKIEGKTLYKEEFVTCGGIHLDEVNFKTMESRLCPGLYFAGEVLDIDGVTGGFNFQNAWTTGYLAGSSLAC